MTNLGICLNAYRRIKDVTLDELARDIGLSIGTLQRIEKGYRPTPKVADLAWRWLTQ